MKEKKTSAAALSPSPVPGTKKGKRKKGAFRSPSLHNTIKPAGTGKEKREEGEEKPPGCPPAPAVESKCNHGKGKTAPAAPSHLLPY